MRSRPFRIVAAGVLVALGGCGASSPGLSATAAEEMKATLAATRAAVDARDRPKAIGSLSALSDIVGRESRAGRLSDSDERALRMAIAQARRRVELDVAMPPPAATAPPPAAPQPVPAPQGPPPDERDEAGKEDQENEDDKDDKDKNGKDGKGDDKGGG